jgi:hypothetical protein
LGVTQKTPPVLTNLAADAVVLMAELHVKNVTGLANSVNGLARRPTENVTPCTMLHAGSQN